MGKNIIGKALSIAVEAHRNQRRKGDNLPYIIHPVMVSVKLIKHDFQDEVIAAALTHDVLEDTDFPEEELRKELGDDVLEIVKTRSHDKSLPWEEKKKRYVEAVRRGSESVKAVAVADKIHNMDSFLIAYEEQGPDLWKKFNRGRDEKIWFEKEMLRMFKETWQHPLIAEYEYLLKKVLTLKSDGQS
jgi:(p)ppGpp synthase/HD superfamily hydrolase